MKTKQISYPVVDLFAGPGGLGEGFASFENEEFIRPFNSLAAIEKDEFSYQTLVLRHFFHSFKKERVPDDYYNYLASSITKEELIAKNRRKWIEAKNTVLKISLGKKNRGRVKRELDQRLHEVNKWILVGGPPCQAYSLAGRSRMNGDPEFRNDERHTLYQEYLQIIIDHQPPIFVMENVKGLLSARLNGESIIHNIMKDLRNPEGSKKKNKTGPGYKLYSFSNSGEMTEDADLKAFIVKAEEHGVPQARHRIFILGIRSDINASPTQLKKRKGENVKQAIGTLPRIRSGVSREEDSVELWKNILTSIEEHNWISPNGKIRDLGKPKKCIKEELKCILQKIRKSNLSRYSRKYTPPNGALRRWYYDERITSINSHESRSHMRSDLHRYLYSSLYASTHNISPKLSDFPLQLLPAHLNVCEQGHNNIFPDRFRVQLKSGVSTTITSHISKDGHYFIHYDPTQCRSLSVREAARLQTFPDNYYFEGPRTSQYHQVGNAVPPYLASQIARIVENIFDQMPKE